MDFRTTGFLLLVSFLITFSGCTLLEDIFKAGAWVGAIAVLIVIGIVFLIVQAVKK